MASPVTTEAPTKRGLRCFHCNKSVSKLSDLSDAMCPKGRFLCAECRELPDVQGLRDAKWVAKRGVHSGAPDYWKDTEGQLRVVTDDNPDGLSNDELYERNNAKALAASVVVDPPSPSNTPVASAHAPPKTARPRAAPKDAVAQVSEFATWYADMLADRALTDADKLYLVGLARYADHATGSNCFPSYEEQASALGWSRKRIRGALASVVAKGWVRLHQMVTSRGRTTYLYQFHRPATATHGAWEGPVEYSNRKGARITV